MTSLPTKPNKKYYFVKDTVIFDIKTTYNGVDTCVTVCGPDDNLEYLPSLTVIEGEDDTSYISYYLDSFIKDGDTFEGNKFAKTVHGEDGDEKTTYGDYYKSLCEERLQELILVYYDKDFQWFEKHLEDFDIPFYMFKKEGVTVSSNEDAEFEVIDFNEEYFDNLKVESVKNAALNAANEVANKYQYIVDEDNFEIKKMPY